MEGEAAVSISIRDDGEPTPLFVQPKDGNNSLDFLKSWTSENREWLDQKLLEHGAILFRGFNVNEGIEFQEVVQSYNPELSDKYRGTSPRTLVPGTEYVFTASELPPVYPIPQHLEMSFLPCPPRKLFFGCLVEPTSVGGETCLCDYKKVYDQMDPDIRREFEEKGVMHIRNYHRKKTLFTDPTMIKGWEDVFGTGDKEEVEREMKSEGLDYSFKKNDDLHIVNSAAAVEKHPDTGDKIWFNHLKVFHWSSLYMEFYSIFKRVKQIKYLLLAILMWILKLIFLNIRGSNRVGFHTCFGDGSEIPQQYIAHLHELVWRNLVFNRWKKGDVLMIDNYRMSHGRQPYSGRRKIVVSWSLPLKRPSLTQSS